MSLIDQNWFQITIASTHIWPISAWSKLIAEFKKHNYDISNFFNNNIFYSFFHSVNRNYAFKQLAKMPTNAKPFLHILSSDYRNLQVCIDCTDIVGYFYFHFHFHFILVKLYYVRMPLLWWHFPSVSSMQ